MVDQSPCNSKGVHCAMEEIILWLLGHGVLLKPYQIEREIKGGGTLYNMHP